MDSLFGTKFIDENGAEHGAEVISGFKLLVLVYTASWWGACKPFKANLLETLKQLNASNPKNVVVLMISGDGD